MSDCVLRLDHVTMQFGGVVAVDNLSMEVRRGEIVALIGPNGAGKTTAFNVVTGVYAPTNGALYFNDELYVCGFPKGREYKDYKGSDADDVRSGNYTATPRKNINKTPDQITKMGMARTFQNIRLFGKLTVFENVLIAKHMRSKGNFISATLRLNYKEERRMRKEAEELLEIVGLSQLKDEKASNLPYGQQRLLEIARALATNPDLLILDEPAAGMNPQETIELTRFIRMIREKFNLTVLLIEHHMNLVMDISDRIYVLEFGKLISNGVPDVVQNDPKVIEAYLGVDLDA